MLGIVVNNLREIQVANATAKKVVDTFEGKKPTNNQYAQTPFGNYRNYSKKMALYNGWLRGKFKEDLIKTDLIFARTNQPVNFASKLDQGVGFGWTLVNYVTKRPVIINYTDYENGKTTLKSSLLNLNTGVYEDFSQDLVSQDPNVFGEEIIAIVKNQIQQYEY